MKRLVPFLALASLGATCGGPDGPFVATDVRVDGAGAPPDGVQSKLPDMCVTPSGTVYAVWVDDRSGTPDVWMNRKLGGGERHEGWLPAPIRVNQVPDTTVFNPKVACDDTAVHVVWEDDRDGEIESHQIYYNKSVTQGDSWDYPTDLLLENDSEGRSQSLEPVIAVGGASVYVAWYDNVFGAYDILFRRSTNQGVEWIEDPQRVDGGATAGEAYSSSVEIATVANGNVVYLTWEDARNGNSDIYFTRSIDQGLTFADPKRLDVTDDPGANNSFSPQIAAEGDAVFVVWHDARSGQNNDVYMAASGDQGLTWNLDSRGDQSDPPGAYQSLYPQVCVSGGFAHVAWHDNRVADGFFRIFYNRASASGSNVGAWLGTEFQLDDHKPDNAGPSKTASIACSDANVIVSWLDQVDDVDEGGELVGFNDIYYNYSEDGGATWLADPFNRIDSIAEASSFKVNVSLALHDGEVHALWGDGRNGTEDIYFQKVPLGENGPVIQASDAPPQPGE